MIYLLYLSFKFWLNSFYAKLIVEWNLFYIELLFTAFLTGFIKNYLYYIKIDKIH